MWIVHFAELIEIHHNYYSKIELVINRRNKLKLIIVVLSLTISMNAFANKKDCKTFIEAWKNTALLGEKYNLEKPEMMKNIYEQTKSLSRHDRELLTDAAEWAYDSVGMSSEFKVSAVKRSKYCK